MHPPPLFPIKSRLLLDFYVIKCPLVTDDPIGTVFFFVEVGTKFNLLEFIFIFDVGFGLYCSVQKSRQNTEIKAH